MVNIFLVDDHPLIIEGFKKILQEIPSINIVGDAKTAEETLAKMAVCRAAHLVLLDFKLPDDDGISVCKKLRAEFPGIKIIFLTSVFDGHIVFRCLQAGANGFVLKNTELQELLMAIKKVMGGEIYISKEANDALINTLQSQAISPAQQIALTRREKEILMLLKKGFTNQEVAKQLSLSTYTVDTHRKNMLQKYNVHNINALLEAIAMSEPGEA